MASNEKARVRSSDPGRWGFLIGCVQRIRRSGATRMGPPTIHMAMAPAPSFLEFSITVSIVAGIAECQCPKPCNRRAWMRDVPGCIDIHRCAALRGKIRPDEAEPEGCGGTTVEGENEVWPGFRRNPGPPANALGLLGWKPKGRGQFPPFLRQSSLGYARYPSLLIPRTRENWLPSPPSR